MQFKEPLGRAAERMGTDMRDGAGQRGTEGGLEERRNEGIRIEGCRQKETRKGRFVSSGSRSVLGAARPWTDLTAGYLRICQIMGTQTPDANVFTLASFRGGAIVVISRGAFLLPWPRSNQLTGVHSGSGSSWMLIGIRGGCRPPGQQGDIQRFSNEPLGASV